MGVVDPELLELLRCPKCKGALAADAAGLSCAGCRVVYPVLDGIPQLLVEEGRPIASEARGG